VVSLISELLGRYAPDTLHTEEHRHDSFI